MCQNTTHFSIKQEIDKKDFKKKKNSSDPNKVSKHKKMFYRSRGDVYDCLKNYYAQKSAPIKTDFMDL
jgi:hypothetical protein